MNVYSSKLKKVKVARSNPWITVVLVVLRSFYILHLSKLTFLRKRADLASIFNTVNIKINIRIW